MSENGQNSLLDPWVKIYKTPLGVSFIFPSMGITLTVKAIK
jgi:hypothetical protein